MLFSPPLLCVCQANDDVTIDHKRRARKGGVEQYKHTNNIQKQQQNKQITASVWVGPVLSYYAEWVGIIVCG